ncbi:hypothetical protein CNYM01_13197 [Colletotrichum nymphaeae SA-01]|uniref:Uncharacterized protein n=1 Tax=Colletotrichum nymphaeae SA-01 TaxID=1460502 RepID=A0A135SAN9_9PEZI|nr:hypothetical protein CNYM01_13197 [Colletotrichum nymphaeae SA-01]
MLPTKLQFQVGGRNTTTTTTTTTTTHNEDTDHRLQTTTQLSEIENSGYLTNYVESLRNQLPHYPKPASTVWSEQQRKGPGPLPASLRLPPQNVTDLHTIRPMISLVDFKSKSKSTYQGYSQASGKRETGTAETLGATSCTSPGHSRCPGASQNESIVAGEPNTYPTTLRQNSSLPKTHEGLWSTVSIVNTPRSHMSKTLDPRLKTREPKYPNDKAMVIENPQTTFSSQEQ